MNYYSTNNKNKKTLMVDFRAALLDGLANDGGLYMPAYIPRLNRSFINDLAHLSFKEVAHEIGKEFVRPHITHGQLKDIIDKAFDFDVPLVKLTSTEDAVLELYHGPTLSFKDFGARFMARTMSFFARNFDNELVVLVATSGDTGSAVASAFYGLEGIRVVILYPSGKVSDIQEKQLTKMGRNITALEIEGSFDDCQRLVKKAFMDKDIKKYIRCSSANSINIGRLIPQSFYYFYGYGQMIKHTKTTDSIVFSVPSGNFGNLTAGILAKKMGLPICKYVAATNINEVVPVYLRTGRYRPKKSHKTLSNSMDVGKPSNFSRMLDIYHNDVSKMRADIWGSSVSDRETEDIIKTIYQNKKYILDPHTAVGYIGLQNFKATKDGYKKHGVVLGTAHPAKFTGTIEPLIGKKVAYPKRLKELITKEKNSLLLSASFSDLKAYLMSS